VGRYDEVDLHGVRGRPLADRPSIVTVEQFVDRRALEADLDTDPLASLPDILAGRQLARLADHVARAAERGKPVVVMLGGHVIKTGVSPCLAALLDAGVVTAFAGNGSVGIHDAEIALVGRTSEVVESALADGAFGIAEESAELLNGAAREALAREEGLGEALGRRLVELSPPHVEASLLARAYRAGVPFTLHVAIGADVVHQHASCDGAAIGAATHRDFRILAAALREVGEGVVLNLGSAVILPEVFMKALNTVRHLGHPSPGIVTANLDFIQHYRPRQNVLARPTREGGEAFALTGHHEVLVPLLARSVLHRLSRG
jgi:hypothetical protein